MAMASVAKRPSFLDRLREACTRACGFRRLPLVGPCATALCRSGCDDDLMSQTETAETPNTMWSDAVARILSGESGPSEAQAADAHGQVVDFFSVSGEKISIVVSEHTCGKGNVHAPAEHDRGSHLKALVQSEETRAALLHHWKAAAAAGSSEDHSLANLFGSWRVEIFASDEVVEDRSMGSDPAMSDDAKESESEREDGPPKPVDSHREKNHGREQNGRPPQFSFFIKSFPERSVRVPFLYQSITEQFSQEGGEYTARVHEHHSYEQAVEILAQFGKMAASVREKQVSGTTGIKGGSGGQAHFLTKLMWEHEECGEDLLNAIAKNKTWDTVLLGGDGYLIPDEKTDDRRFLQRLVRATVSGEQQFLRGGGPETTAPLEGDGVEITGATTTSDAGEKLRLLVAVDGSPRTADRSDLRSDRSDPAPTPFASTSKSLLAFSTFLHHNLGSLRTLTLNNKNLTDGFVCVLAARLLLPKSTSVDHSHYIRSRCPLQTLSLSENRITDKGVAYLAAALPSLCDLEHLSLGQNRGLGDDGVRALSLAIQSGGRGKGGRGGEGALKLRYLSLVGTWAPPGIGGTWRAPAGGGGEVGADRLVRLRSFLHDVCLRSGVCPCGGGEHLCQGKGSWSSGAHGIGDNRKLPRWQEGGISDRGVFALAEMVSENDTLTFLDIADHKRISRHRGGLALAKAVACSRKSGADVESRLEDIRVSLSSDKGTEPMVEVRTRQELLELYPEANES